MENYIMRGLNISENPDYKAIGLIYKIICLDINEIDLLFSYNRCRDYFSKDYNKYVILVNTLNDCARPKCVPKDIPSSNGIPSAIRRLGLAYKKDMYKFNSIEEYYGYLKQFWHPEAEEHPMKLMGWIVSSLLALYYILKDAPYRDVVYEHFNHFPA
jgi:hypothetical protein